MTGQAESLIGHHIDVQRRTFVMAASSITAGGLLPAADHSTEPKPASLPLNKDTTMYAYVGSRTTRERNARGEGITVFRVTPSNGAMERIQVVGDLVNPSYQVLSKDGNFLYTVHGDESEVSAFAVDKTTGLLRFLNRQSTQGKNPVHLAIDPTGKFLLVTNHIGSSLAVLPFAADGALLPVQQLVTLSGPIGPHRIEQKQSKPHFNPFTPSGRFVIVPDKGLDRVFSFRFEDGHLTPASTPFVGTREGAGPRHLAFHPQLPIAYVVNELDSTISTYGLDAETGALTPRLILPTLPADFTGNSRAAGIAVDGQGRYLYSSNRGHDSLAVFRLDPTTGLPSFMGADPTQGRTPRFFTLSPNGQLLFTLNEDSDTIVAFFVDTETGRLTPTGQRHSTGSPVCMVFSA